MRQRPAKPITEPRPGSPSPLCSWGLALTATIGLAAGQCVAQGEAERAEDPRTVVFVPDRCGANEGAPPADNLGTLVLLTDLQPQDDYHGVVELLEKSKKPVAIVRYPKGNIAACAGQLKQLLPEHVLVVTRPGHIEANQHFALLELAASLDEDPFVDFTIGYVTGATPEEALAFTRRFLAVGRKRNALPRTMFDFGPAKNKTLQEGGPTAHDLAKGWKKTWVYHGSVEEMRKRARKLHGHGVLHAGGHGEPERIVDGLTAHELRSQRFDLSPALYFSGPCYCGVTGLWYRPGAKGIDVVQVEPMSSFALAVLASGATALFAGLDPDRLEQSSQELEHLWVHGDSLGRAIKETYDGTTMALRRSVYRLFRYKEGHPRPQKNLAMTMIGGGASRVLYGDPTYVPFTACAKPAFPVRTKRGRKALTIEWKARQKPDGWLAVDVYRCGGRWTNRIAFRERIPLKVARELESFQVEKLTSETGPLPGRFPTAMVERWGGRAYLHVYVVFEPGGLPPDARNLQARFVFRK